MPSCQKCWGQGKVLRERWGIPVGLNNCPRCGGSGWESDEAVELRRLRREHAEKTARKAERDEAARLRREICEMKAER